MFKPKGGRGKAAPYSTRQVRVPEPVIFQVDKLIELYQKHISEGGDAINPPDFLFTKPVDKFSDEWNKPVNRFSEEHNQIILLLEEALKLKANAGGAIKEKIREVIQILNSL